MTKHSFRISVPEWPGFIPEVREAVDEALRSGDWGRYHGKQSTALSETLRAWLGQSFVTLCSSGTIGVEFALRGIGVGSGDEVILAGYDFPGNFRSIEATGAFPVLVDVRPQGWVPTLESLQQAISPNTRAVLLSHLHGDSLAAAEIRQWCDAEGLKLIEDACQVPGASLQGRRLGSFGHVSVLSFGGSKLLSAGRGGAVLTDDAEIHQRIKIWTDRGNDLAPLSELQAAVLLPQLQQLPAMHDRRLQGARVLSAALRKSEAPLELVEVPSGDSPAYYKFPLLLTDDRGGGASRLSICQRLQQAGIPAFEGFGFFGKRSAKRCRTSGDLIHARNAAAHTIVLHHPLLLMDPTTLEEVALEITRVLKWDETASQGG